MGDLSSKLASRAARLGAALSLLVSARADPRRTSSRPISVAPSPSRRGSVVDPWDLARERVIGSVDLAPTADEPTATTMLEPCEAIFVGTAQGRLLRLDA